MASYYLFANSTNHELSNYTNTMDKICVCCSSQNVLIDVSTCKHTTFLKRMDKLKIILEEAYVCIACHNMLKKIDAFQQQVEETFTLLTDPRQDKKGKKFQNLQRSVPYITDSTQPEPDPDPDPFKLEIKPETVSVEVSEEEIDLQTDFKVECYSSDYEPTESTSKKSQKKLEPKNRYEGRIRNVTLTLAELKEERQSLATQAKYVSLPYKCEDCIVGFDHEHTYKSHMEQRHTVHDNDFQCSICKSVLSTKSSYNEHTKRHLKRFDCMVCNKRYSHVQSAIQHYDEKHMPPGSSLQRAYQCHCGFTTTTKQSSQGSQNIIETGHHQDQLNTRHTINVIVNRTYRYHLNKHKKKEECKVCGNTFITASSLRVHMYTVHQQSSRVYRCDACDKTYRAKSGLKSHLHSAHGDAPRAYCAPCRTHYMTHYALQAHLNTHSRHIDDGDKKFTCDECGAKFIRKFSLQIHINWEHLKLTTHQCTTCSKAFKSASTLRRHISYVHEKERPPRNKICHFCGRGFTTQTILQSHIRTHTGERPLQCQHCRATFAHSAALYTHIKLKHKIIK